MNAQTNKIDLSQVKSAAQVIGDFAEVSILWNGVSVPLTASLVRQIIVEGVYRQASMDSAKGGYTAEFEADFIKRLSSGYLKASDLIKAQKALEPKAAGKGGRAIAFSQTEIVSQARGMTKAKEALATLDKVALYDDKQFGLLLVKVSDKPDSLISKAIAALTQAANEKAAAELTAALEEIDII